MDLTNKKVGKSCLFPNCAQVTQDPHTHYAFFHGMLRRRLLELKMDPDQYSPIKISERTLHPMRFDQLIF